MMIISRKDSPAVNIRHNNVVYMRLILPEFMPHYTAVIM